MDWDTIVRFIVGVVRAGATQIRIECSIKGHLVISDNTGAKLEAGNATQFYYWLKYANGMEPTECTRPQKCKWTISVDGLKFRSVTEPTNEGGEAIIMTLQDAATAEPEPQEAEMAETSVGGD
jgi:hypothetical protein